jgi:hypothetical protein
LNMLFTLKKNQAKRIILKCVENIIKTFDVEHIYRKRYKTEIFKVYFHIVMFFSEL